VAGGGFNKRIVDILAFYINSGQLPILQAPPAGSAQL
jgi:hypothetical protein